jgi:hypothetical protein
MVADLQTYSGWIGLALLSLIFLANALGIIDQERAVRELANAGLPRTLAHWARGLIGAGLPARCGSRAVLRQHPCARRARARRLPRCGDALRASVLACRAGRARWAARQLPEERGLDRRTARRCGVAGADMSASTAAEPSFLRSDEDDPLVTVIREIRVQPGKEAEFEELMPRLIAEAKRQLGHLGATVVRPDSSTKN